MDSKQINPCITKLQNEMPLNLEIRNREGLAETDFTNSIVLSVRWTLLGNILPRLITPISTLILAALLSPADFGVVAITAIFIAFAQIMVDSGLGIAVIRSQDDLEQAASSALWLGVMIALFLYVVLWMTSPLIADAFHSNALITIIRIAALALPISAAASIPRALLQKRNDFQRYFWVLSSFMVSQAIVTVVLALVGLGVWSLVWGQLAGSLTSMVLAWILARWHPSMFIERAILVSLFRFGIWVMISDFYVWLSMNADNALAGLFLGEAGLGIYSLGRNIANLFPGLVSASLATAAYPAFCLLQREPRDIGRHLLNLQSIEGALVFPTALGLSAISSPVIHLLYGEKWLGLDIVIAYMAIMPGMSHLWSINADAYRSIGRPDLWTKLTISSALIMMPLLWLTAHYGLLIFTIVRFGCSLFIPIGTLLVGRQVLGISLEDQVKALFPTFISALGMFIFIHFLIDRISPFSGAAGWGKLTFIVGMGVISYLVLLRLIDRNLWVNVVKVCRQAIS